MLWVNGYTGAFTTFLGLTPPGGKFYWPSDQKAAFFVLKDFNAMYVNPGAGMFSTAKERFKKGYNYAKNNLQKIKSHILISGNRLQIVAHSHGVAFAEGIAAYLFEEEAFVTELLIAIQGSNCADISQESKSIACRLQFSTDGDYVANKSKQILKCRDIEITENCLKSGYLRYRIIQTSDKGTPGAEYIYMKQKMPWLKRHFAHRERQFEVWTAINHALAMYKRQPETAKLFNAKHIQPEVLQQYVQNQN